MMRPRQRYSLLPSSDDRTSSSVPSFEDEDEEELLTRPPPIVYPHDPRFDQPTPPTWQRVGLILIIVVSVALADWDYNLESGPVHWENGLWKSPSVHRVV
ncbi:hypothetical protein DFH07DRAFT_964203 [Mycena maculata]|uniref:Uncharacterized protein n=1 Tax=Mycena maculata TaxID=230809 RepID=A0AAD7IIU7_9AGAR|nr:hypothetical protein DFH07DRAFT_964203 [Mycena maculata]